MCCVFRPGVFQGKAGKTSFGKNMLVQHTVFQHRGKLCEKKTLAAVRMTALRHVQTPKPNTDPTVGRFSRERVRELLRAVYKSAGEVDEAYNAFVSNAKIELVAGNWDRGGAVTFILDMAVTDEMEGEVHEMLHMLHEFDNTQLDECPETATKFNSGWFKKAEGKPCYLCGRKFVPEALVSEKCTRMPQFGYEIGKELVMDQLVREKEHALTLSMMEVSAQKRYEAGLKMVEGMLTVVDRQLAKMAREKEKDGSKQGSVQKGDQDNKPAADPRKAKREQNQRKLQLRFKAELETLRSKLEDVTYAKPVCRKCKENCDTIAGAEEVAGNVVDARTGTKEVPVTAVAGGKKAKKSGGAAPATKVEVIDFRKGWATRRQRLDEEAANWDEKFVLNWNLAANRDPNDKRPVKAVTLNRGGWYGEPLELARRCNGRVNTHQPMEIDDPDFEPDTFCDVRFDRMEGKAAAPKLHCLYSGKVFCRTCMGQGHNDKPNDLHAFPILEKWDDPEKAKPSAVCTEAKKELAVAQKRIQPRSQKEDDDEGKTKKKSGTEPVEEEEAADDDEPSCLFGLVKIDNLRTLPMCGGYLADQFEPEDA